MLGALAQEESSNTSKRVKFGKKENAKKGRVPNLVFGYDKTNGDYFNLTIIEEEANVVRQIFDWYTKEGYGANKISSMLNEKGIFTKRGCQWTQNAVARILKNEIYIGQIINGKEEIGDFLTGNRIAKEESEWHVTERPDLAIIEVEQYEHAKSILEGRNKAFNVTRERQSNRYTFSTLIKCADCGFSFRCMERKYQNTFVTWVCSGRNGRGADSCSNTTKIPEEDLLQAIRQYFTYMLSQKEEIAQNVVREFNRIYKAKGDNESYEKELDSRRKKLSKTKDKYTQMFMDDLITRDELKSKLSGINEELSKVESELKIVSYNLSKGDRLETILERTFKDMGQLLTLEEINNVNLKKVIQKILVHENGTIDIHLKLFSDIGLDESVLLAVDSESAAAYMVTTEELDRNKNIPINNNRT